MRGRVQEEASESTRKENKTMQNATKKHIGAHVSIEGGIDKAVQRMRGIGACAMGMFVKNQKTYKARELNTAEIEAFRAQAETELEGEMKYVLPHASYLINLAQSDEEKRKRSYGVLIEEMRRCRVLGIPHINVHPGSDVGGVGTKQACKLVAESINRAHKEISRVTVLVENMAGQGRTLCRRFEEIKMIIDGVEDKSRVGVCLDTCHMFGAGYDIRTEKSFAKVMDEFRHIVGIEYLKGMHLNDSKMALGSKQDRHASIGEGLIGKEAFAYVMNAEWANNIPLILETPSAEKYIEEITMLYGMIKQKEE